MNLRNLTPVCLLIVTVCMTGVLNVRAQTASVTGLVAPMQQQEQQLQQLSVRLKSPANGVTVIVPPSLVVDVASSGIPIQGATVIIYLDGTQICSAITDSSGSYACTVPQLLLPSSISGQPHTWYASASMQGYSTGTSPTWTFIFKTPS